MISKMIKYRFLLYHADQEKFIKRLGEIGVLDITLGEYTPNDTELKRVQELTALNATIDSLTKYAEGRELTTLPDNTLNASDSVDKFNLLWAEREERNNTKAQLEKDINNAEHWGAFSVNDVKRLESSGLKMHYYSCSQRDFSMSYLDDYYFSIISKSGSTIYFVAYEREGEEFILPEINLTEYRALNKDVTTLNKELNSCYSDLERIDNELCILAKGISALQEEADELTLSLRQYRIESGNRREAENMIIVIDGWVPAESAQELEHGISHFDGVITLSEKPTIEDEPPIKLKNSKLVSPAEIITRLFSLPNYHEVDVTPFFAPFFIFFVGICIGDAIYGGLIFLISLIALLKAKKETKPIFTLVLWCSVASIIMGAVTGMYGGIIVEKTMLLNSDQMFYFAIGVGVLQLLYAMLLKTFFAMKRFGFIYGVAHLGWVMTLLTVLSATILPLIGNDSFSTSSPLFLPLLIGSLILTIFFQNPKKNPLVNFGAGLWFLYNGVVGMLSDTLSYIRLFALGLSGGIIATAFNTIAVELSPDNPILKFIVMGLILAIGHGINLFMSAISAFVHPLRLTFVEFYKNVGFEGGGKAYDPFVRGKK